MAAEKEAPAQSRRFHVDGDGLRKGKIVAYGVEFPTGRCAVEMFDRSGQFEGTLMTFDSSAAVDGFFMSLGDGCLGWDDGTGRGG